MAALEKKVKREPVKACASSQMSVYDGVEHWAKREAGERVNGTGTERAGAYADGFDLAAGS